MRIPLSPEMAAHVLFFAEMLHTTAVIMELL